MESVFPPPEARIFLSGEKATEPTRDRASWAWIDRTGERATSLVAVAAHACPTIKLRPRKQRAEGFINVASLAGFLHRPGTASNWTKNRAWHVQTNQAGYFSSMSLLRYLSMWRSRSDKPPAQEAALTRSTISRHHDSSSTCSLMNQCIRV